MKQIGERENYYWDKKKSYYLFGMTYKYLKEANTLRDNLESNVVAMVFVHVTNIGKAYEIEKVTCQT